MIPPEDEAHFLTDIRAASENEHHVHRPIRSVARLRRTDRWRRGALPTRASGAPGWCTTTAPEGAATYSIDEPPERQSIRDLAEEQRKLAELPLPYEIPQLANRSKELQQQPAAHVLLDGMAALTFVEQVLPQLGLPGCGSSWTGRYASTARPALSRACRWRPSSVPTPPTGSTCASRSRSTERRCLSRICSRLTGQGLLDLGNRSLFLLGPTEFAQLRDLIEESKALHDRHRPELTISRFQASLWDDLQSLGVAIDQSARWEQSVRGLIDVSSIADLEVPETLRATLRPYQLEGYRWLGFLWTHQLGGILADDMGLGKTLQALALICHARLSCPEQPPFLVVAPTSVVSNWSNEAARFAPDLGSSASQSGPSAACRAVRLLPPQTW